MPSAIVGVVHVGVHVPDEVGRHRDEAAAALAQPPRQQQQLAERLGVVDVVLVVVPLLVDVLRPDQRARCRSARPSSRSSFDRSNASPTPPSRIDERLLREPRRCPRAPSSSPAFGGVEAAQQRAAVVEPVERQLQLHVLLERAVAVGLERRGRRPAERAGATRTCRSSSARPGRRDRRRAGRGRRCVGMPVAGWLPPATRRVGRAEVGAEASPCRRSA